MLASVSGNSYLNREISVGRAVSTKECITPSKPTQTHAPSGIQRLRDFDSTQSHAPSGIQRLHNSDSTPTSPNALTAQRDLGSICCTSGIQQLRDSTFTQPSVNLTEVPFASVPHQSLNSDLSHLSSVRPNLCEILSTLETHRDNSPGVSQVPQVVQVPSASPTPLTLSEALNALTNIEGLLVRSDMGRGELARLAVESVNNIHSPGRVWEATKRLASLLRRTVSRRSNGSTGSPIRAGRADTDRRRGLSSRGAQIIVRSMDHLSELATERGEVVVEIGVTLPSTKRGELEQASLNNIYANWTEVNDSFMSSIRDKYGDYIRKVELCEQRTISTGRAFYHLHITTVMPLSEIPAARKYLSKRWRAVLKPYIKERSPVFNEVHVAAVRDVDKWTSYMKKKATCDDNAIGLVHAVCGEDAFIPERWFSVSSGCQESIKAKTKKLDPVEAQVVWQWSYLPSAVRKEVFEYCFPKKTAEGVQVGIRTRLTEFGRRLLDDIGKMCGGAADLVFCSG